MQWLTEDELAVEATDESVSGTVGVNDLIGVDQMNWVLVRGALVNNNGWQVALRNDDSALALVVNLGELSHLLGDFLDISGLPLAGRGECQSLSLIAEQVVAGMEKTIVVIR